MMRVCTLIAFLVLSFWSTCEASFIIYQFDTDEQEQRFRSLINELRCPMCQNQSIADSDASIAMDLKDIVYEMVKAGATDDDIRVFMRDRYGDFVLYRPPIEPKNYLLWFGPFVLLLGVIIGLIVMHGKRKKKQIAPMDSKDQERMDKLMHELEENK